MFWLLLLLLLLVQLQGTTTTTTATMTATLENDLSDQLCTSYVSLFHNMRLALCENFVFVLVHLGRPETN